MNDEPTATTLLKAAWGIGQALVLFLVVPYYLVRLPFQILDAERGAVFWGIYGVVVAGLVAVVISDRRK